jgi:hypothetical protein
LQAERSVFDGNGLVAAQQETNESNHIQKKGWRVSRLFAFIRSEVNLIRADRVMAKDGFWLRTGVFGINYWYTRLRAQWSPKFMT